MTPFEAGAGPVPLVCDRLSGLGDRLAEAPGLLLCLDFDGTQAPIVPDPDAAQLLSRNYRLLRTLRAEPAVEVGIISGRSLADLSERVGVDGVHYVGNHGLERYVDGDRIVLPEARAFRPQLDRAVESLRASLNGIPGVLVEDKELTATVNYQRVPSTRVEDVRTTVTDVVAELDGLRLTPGKQIIEVRPDRDVGKDRAVRQLRAMYPDYLTMYVGDDVTDEDAFREVVPEGIAVHVGDREDTASTLRVRDPEDVTALLSWLTTACDEHFGRTDGDP